MAIAISEQSHFIGEALPLTRNDKFFHIKFQEASHPDLAREAWRIHAEGYHAMGFVTEDAITDEGFLAPEIDKSRGPNTDYYLAVNPQKEEDCATMRKVNLPEGGTYHDLPSYGVSKAALFPEAEAELASLEGADKRLKEIAALARSREGSALGVHEIFRRVIQEAHGSNEVWFSTLVSTTYESLARSFGEDNFIVVGEDVAIKDDRVVDGIMLRPTVIIPSVFISNVLNSYRKAEGADQRILRRSFLFLTEGMDKDQLGEEVYQARLDMLGPRAA